MSLTSSIRPSCSVWIVATPIWTLRAQSVRGQAAGLIVPTLAYVAVLVPALCAARGFPVSQSLSIVSPAVGVCAALGAAVVLYAGVAKRGIAGKRKQEQ